jgi:PHD/YefM family antitoxin component YafN of YafNO toxin-antitoxin module
MSLRVSLKQLRDQLPELLDDAVESGREYVVQRNGKDYAVIVSALAWRRRMLDERLNALGPAFRLSRTKQRRAEKLLAIDERKRTAAERRELTALLRECDDILARRAQALDSFE